MKCHSNQPLAIIGVGRCSVFRIPRIYARAHDAHPRNSGNGTGYTSLHHHKAEQELLHLTACQDVALNALHPYSAAMQRKPVLHLGMPAVTVTAATGFVAWQAGTIPVLIAAVLFVVGLIASRG